MINILDFGADPEGRAPSDPAFAAAEATGDSTIYLPRGTYLLRNNLVLEDRPVTLVGDGGCYRGSATTIRLREAASILVRRRGSHSVLSRMCIRGTREDRPPRRKMALVKAEATIHLTDCYVCDSLAHGVHIDGSKTAGNANFWSIRNVTIEHCGKTSVGRLLPGCYGLRVDGQDSQGDALGLRVIDSWGGICDSSFLGCTWVACYVEACKGEGCRSETGRSQWIGCYCELDSPASMGSCLILGGPLASTVNVANELPSGKGASNPYTKISGSVLDPLAARLADPRRPIDRWLVSRLSASTRAAAEAFRTAPRPRPSRDPLADRFRALLLEDLNAILSGPSIYETERFRDVELRRETRTLVAMELEGRELEGRDPIRRNRLLLEDAYPELPTSAISPPFVLDVDAANGLAIGKKKPGGGKTRIITLGTATDGKTLLELRDVDGKPEMSLRNVDSAWQFWQQGLKNESLALAITHRGHARGAGRIVAPQGVVVGSSASAPLVDAAWLNAIETRLAALERGSSRSGGAGDSEK